MIVPVDSFGSNRTDYAHAETNEQELGDSSDDQPGTASTAGNPKDTNSIPRMSEDLDAPGGTSAECYRETLSAPTPCLNLGCEEAWLNDALSVAGDAALVRDTLEASRVAHIGSRRPHSRGRAGRPARPSATDRSRYPRSARSAQEPVGTAPSQCNPAEGNRILRPGSLPGFHVRQRSSRQSGTHRADVLPAAFRFCVPQNSDPWL
jgi:hypothetical protein